MNAGFLLIDKPKDWTSHDVVGYLRGVTKIKKIGHAGTLDPFATGLLIVGIGREATKRLDEFKNMKKEYVATVTLGATSDTQDSTGTIEHNAVGEWPSEDEIRAVLETFVGKQLQTPPMYSAKKVKGKKLYELARKGMEVEREPVEIEIFEIELQDVISSDQRESRNPPQTSKDGDLSTPFASLTSVEMTFRVVCSKGTYIRTLCHDIGSKLGVGGYCEELRRTAISEYHVEDAREPKSLTTEMIEGLTFI